MRLEPFTPAPATHASGMRVGSTIVFAGQVGLDQTGHVPTSFAEQVRIALANILAIVAKGGGKAQQIVQLTWYVTALDKYYAEAEAVGDVFRKAFGDHLPAMTLVGVTGLMEPRCHVEIDGMAIVA
jgi:enamine deaminase RidA (YjgF/YER057c/UK114 family)